jgi:hypothetical protein
LYFYVKRRTEIQNSDRLIIPITLLGAIHEASRHRQDIAPTKGEIASYLGLIPKLRTDNLWILTTANLDRFLPVGLKRYGGNLRDWDDARH